MESVLLAFPKATMPHVQQKSTSMVPPTDALLDAEWLYGFDRGRNGCYPWSSSFAPNQLCLPKLPPFDTQDRYSAFYAASRRAFLYNNNLYPRLEAVANRKKVMT